MEMFVLPKQLLCMANFSLSLNTACVVMHSFSLRHFRETAWNGGHNPLVTKQNLIQLLCSACLSTQLSVPLMLHLPITDYNVVIALPCLV